MQRSGEIFFMLKKLMLHVLDTQGGPELMLK